MRIKAAGAHVWHGGVVPIDRVVTLPNREARQAPRASVAALLPREHGSWALVAEPLVLALLVAPSWRGGALACAGLGLFLLRRPWQVVQSRGPTRVPLTQAWWALCLLGVVTLLCSWAGVQGSRSALGPLALAAGLAAVFAWYDHRRRARGWIAELTGAACFAAWAGAIVLAEASAGQGRVQALAVGVFAATRAITSILPVRVCLRRRKGERAPGAPALGAAAVCGVAAATAGWMAGTWIPACWSAAFLLRTAWFVGPQCPSWPARRIGILEAALGAAAILSTGAALA